MVNRIIEAGPVNWSEALAKYYAEDEKKRARHGELLKQRDAQQLEANKRASPITALGNLAKFSSSVNTLVKAKKQADKKAEDGAKTQAAVDYTLLNADDQKIFNDLAKHKEGVNNLKVDYNRLRDAINKSGMSEAGKQYIASLHGGRLVHLHEHLGFATLERLPSLLKEAEKDAVFQEKYDQERLEGREKDFLKKFAMDKFGELRLDDKFIVNSLYKPLDKWLSTKGVIGALRSKSTYLTDQETELNTEIDTSLKLDDNGYAAVQTFQQQIKSDKEGAVARYYRLGASGGLKQHELDAILNGQLPVPFAGGETGRSLLSKEQISFIQSGITEYNTKVKANSDAAVLQEISATGTAIREGTGSIPELQALKTKTLSLINRTLGSHSEEYKTLEALDVTLQQPGSYAKQRQSNDSYFNGADQGARLRDEKIFKQNISSGRLVDELGKKVEEDKAYFTSVGLPTTYQGHVDEAVDKLKTSPGQLNKLDKGVVALNDTKKRIVEQMALQRQLFHAESRKQLPNDNRRAYIEAETLYNQWLDGLGFNEIDDGRNPRAGIVSPDRAGNYKLYAGRYAASVENTRKGTLFNSKMWGSRVQEAAQIHATINDALNSPNSLTDPPDLLGVFTANPPDTEGNIKPYFSPEIYFKAAALNIQPATLIAKQIRALKKSPVKSDQEFLRKFKLEQYLPILERQDAGVKVEEALAELLDKKLLFIWNHGVTKASPNQLRRIARKLSGFAWKPDDPADYRVP